MHSEKELDKSVTTTYKNFYKTELKKKLPSY